MGGRGFYSGHEKESFWPFQRKERTHGVKRREGGGRVSSSSLLSVHIFHISRRGEQTGAGDVFCTIFTMSCCDDVGRARGGLLSCEILWKDLVRGEEGLVVASEGCGWLDGA